ncbi:MAG: hypothetical protein V2B15_03595 [Bacteroidota bacterium]
MIRVTFKDVGQGDSIIIEWEDKEKKKIGIVDCVSYAGTNPTLNYIIENEIHEISFVLLSHPHLDHFSGISELLNYCFGNGVNIKNFLHTSNNMPGFWKAAVEGMEAEEKIIELFLTARKLRDYSGMGILAIQANSVYDDIRLNDEYNIKIIAPESSHLDHYANRYTEFPAEEEHGNNPHANWLCTIIKIYSRIHGGYILLTSDCNKDLLFYKRKEPGEFDGKLILAQCPHHGADSSFKSSFWNLVERADKTPIVFSVGRNIYGHPSAPVVTSLQKSGYNLYSTNEVGALVGLTEYAESDDAINHLGIYGTMLPANRLDKFNGEKAFIIDSRGRVSLC